MKEESLKLNTSKQKLLGLILTITLSQIYLQSNLFISLFTHALLILRDSSIFFFLSTKLFFHYNSMLMHFSITNIFRGVMRFMHFWMYLYFRDNYRLPICGLAQI